jgi:integrase
MARALTGTLVWQKRGWCARIPQVVEGVRIKPIYFLDTSSKPLAKRRMARLIAEIETGRAPDAGTAGRSETFVEVAERVHPDRVKDGVKSAKDEIARLRAYALPTLGLLDVTKIDTTHINEVLDECKRAGRSRETTKHLKMDLSHVFAALKREGAIKINPVDEAELPKFADAMSRQRAVLTDDELARYIVWRHPLERFREAVLERQTMACVARMFGGLRTGDLHALKWESLDAEQGRFEFGWAARRKTSAPQLLEIPAMLRPILRDWWERRGRQLTGPVFPARRGERIGEEKKKGSHAQNFRRDLERAFGLVRWRQTGVNRKGNPVGVWEPTPGRERTRREVELFEQTEFTLPVDFHSWRRAFSQALADADVTAQQAQALAGHASMSAHQRYLRNAGKMRRLPAAALPAWGPSDIIAVQSSGPVVQNLQESTVGVRGFEPPTAGTQSRPSTRLRYTPEVALKFRKGRDNTRRRAVHQSGIGRRVTSSLIGFVSATTRRSHGK